ncbi:MAG TPA: replication-associated recombination protein A [Candidatus Eremiobacteraceae bacterium]|nr:replication-associated recombination protein A [Candidatus Eremiobacteraceae bacterium]
MEDRPSLFGPAERPDSIDALGPDAPLAARMRPRTLDEFVGQRHIVGEGAGLRVAIETGKVPSMILWGPPGTGKTTLARLIARTAKARFVALSAVTAGVADLRRAIADASLARRNGGRHTILFIDEIHRFNKAQQDAVLPHVERGDVTLIGATTENPSFEVNSALLSRSRTYVLEALSEDDLGIVVDRALSDKERGLGGSVSLEPDARSSLIALADGDARVALNTLELSAEMAGARSTSARITKADVEEAMQRRALRYDRAGDEHYDVISAYIKSIRGSDADAAIYWLARMLEAGEDPMFVARRLVISASEDVGLADPRAMSVAIAAHQAAHAIGMPEAMFPLAEATLYLALAPKSNSTLRAYSAASEAIEQTGTLPVPLHLRNAVTNLMRRLGYGENYKYAHDYEGSRVDQQHLPDELAGRRFYDPGENDFKR